MTGLAKRSGRGKLEQLKNSRFIAGASQRTAGQCPGGLSLLDHSFSVDEQITHAFGIMIRIFECGVIDDPPTGPAVTEKNAGAIVPNRPSARRWRQLFAVPRNTLDTPS